MNVQTPRLTAKQTATLIDMRPGGRYSVGDVRTGGLPTATANTLIGKGLAVSLAPFGTVSLTHAGEALRAELLALADQPTSPEPVDQSPAPVPAPETPASGPDQPETMCAHCNTERPSLAATFNGWRVCAGCAERLAAGPHPEWLALDQEPETDQEPACWIMPDTGCGGVCGPCGAENEAAVDDCLTAGTGPDAGTSGPDQADEEDRDAFTRGACWLLAWHLADQGGGDVVALDGPDGHARHFVAVVNGVALDVDGPTTLDQVADAWSGAPRTLDGAERFELELARHDEPELDARAEELARRMVAAARTADEAAELLAEAHDDEADALRHRRAGNYQAAAVHLTRADEYRVRAAALLTIDAEPDETDPWRIDLDDPATPQRRTVDGHTAYPNGYGHTYQDPHGWTLPVGAHTAADLLPANVARRLLALDREAAGR